jgi:hypothetical protein
VDESGVRVFQVEIMWVSVETRDDARASQEGFTGWEFGGEMRLCGGMMACVVGAVALLR